MARITQKEILNHFFDAFFNGKVLTSSEYRMQAIKLKNLKKVVKEYIENAKIDTNKSVEQIIMETIDYAKMKGKKFNSIASLGYDVLPQSITYWKKAELAAQKLEEEAKKQKEVEERTSEFEKKLAESNKQKAETKKVPKWFLDDSEDYDY